MGLDVYFAEDIRNALAAADEAATATARACAATSGDPVMLRAYLEGYMAALTVVALAFGLVPSLITPNISQEILGREVCKFPGWPPRWEITPHRR